MKIKVLYEDSNILAVDKPSGISVHGDGRSKPARLNSRSGRGKTVADWVLENYPKMKNVGEDEIYENKKIKTKILKPGVVHRLDRETSGVLLLAKNQKAYEFLKKQFQERKIKKVYNAIVNGFVKDDHGFVKKPIGRSPADFRKWLSGRGARGELREAETFYKVLKRFEISHNKFSYLEIHPRTGRTHQIRVHMKFVNHPVVCDSLYNPDNPYPKGIKRLALHAKSIEFKNLNGKMIKIESPLPKEFEKIIK